MNTKESIKLAYDRTAQDYAATFWNELEQKPFDQILLNWFATQIPAGERLLEIGAGPGEVSAYLSQRGVNCLAMDLSEQMVENGRKYFSHIQFEVQDFFNLGYADGTFWGVIGYYAIVNLNMEEVRRALAEVKRVLREGGIFLFTFHIFEGEDAIHVDTFLSQEGIDLTFFSSRWMK